MRERLVKKKRHGFARQRERKRNRSRGEGRVQDRREECVSLPPPTCPPSSLLGEYFRLWSEKKTRKRQTELKSM